MKMVKSLLLGSAAGLVAVAGAQAADLPVKAKPVEYVKICSLYGVGFYYIPGTDMCLKIGGWVRAEYAYNDNGNMTNGPWAGNAQSRNTSQSTFRARGYITADARNQTEYGTVRGYIAVGINTSDVGLNTAANQFSANRAFIQWAGFTMGLAQSFFDFYSVPATSYWGNFPASDTGDPGWFVMGYTAQFGNGFSATISAEERRITQLINAGLNAGIAGAGGIAPGAYPSAATFTNPTSVGGTNVGGFGLGGGSGFAPGAGAYGGFQAPDIIGNLRVDQAWGSAQLMGALHEVNAGYYDGGTSTGALSPALGHPSDKLGWVVGAGFKVNATVIGQGDFFQMQANYTEGAVKYIFQSPNFNYGMASSNTQAYGITSDAVFGGSLASGTGTDLQLTTAWNVNAAYEHFWSPRWRTSLYGGYAAVTYNSTANNLLCANIAAPAGVGVPTSNGSVGIDGCDNNWQTWWIGSRTQWNVTKDFYMGVDVLYSKLQTASPQASGIIPANLTGGGATGLAIAGSSCVAGTCTARDLDNWQFRFRAHRDFYP
jgi:hypothetical protein